jgi:hypothetical protein
MSCGRAPICILLSASNRNEYQGSYLGVKTAGAGGGAEHLNTSFANCLKILGA